MRAFAVLFLGVVVGWTASGVDWSREAVGEVTASAIDEEPTGPVGSIRARLVQEQIVADADGTKRIVKEERLVSPDILCQVPTGGILVGRFQATAYGSPSGNGCYVVDTMTGKTWHAANGQPARVVTEALIQTSGQPTTPAYFDASPLTSRPVPMLEGRAPVEPPRTVVPTPVPQLAEPEPDDAN